MSMLRDLSTCGDAVMILFCLPQPRMLGTHRVVGVVNQVILLCRHSRFLSLRPNEPYVAVVAPGDKSCNPVGQRAMSVS
jgi:hypothetical protein